MQIFTWAWAAAKYGCGVTGVQYTQLPSCLRLILVVLVAARRALSSALVRIFFRMPLCAQDFVCAQILSFQLYGRIIALARATPSSARCSRIYPTRYALSLACVPIHPGAVTLHTGAVLRPHREPRSSSCVVAFP